MHPQTQPCLWELMQEMCAPLLQLTHGSSTSLGLEPPFLGISGCRPLRPRVQSVLAARSLFCLPFFGAGFFVQPGMCQGETLFL